jgi:hypothetical protein
MLGITLLCTQLRRALQGFYAEPVREWPLGWCSDFKIFQEALTIYKTANAHSVPRGVGGAISSARYCSL